jgi:hypothetical protein
MQGIAPDQNSRGQDHPKKQNITRQGMANAVTAVTDAPRGFHY